MGNEDEEFRKGQDAERFVNDPIYVTAFEDTKKQLVDLLFQTKVSEQEERDRVYITIKALEHVEQHIQSVINTGKLAKGLQAL